MKDGKTNSMKTTYRIEKSFGPVGTSAGYLLVLVGLVQTYFSLYGLILVAIGAFVGFTATSTQIDFSKKRVRFTNALYGFIHIGEWMAIEPDMKLGIKKNTSGYRVYSQTNRILNINQQDFRIYLFDSDKTLIMPIMSCPDQETAQKQLEKSIIDLELSRI